MSEFDLPVVIEIKRICSSRYPNLDSNFYNCLKRPLSWDDRLSGTEEVLTQDGASVLLFSNGQQPTPEPGWRILLTAGNATDGYEWTLYGLASAAA